MLRSLVGSQMCIRDRYYILRVRVTNKYIIYYIGHSALIKPVIFIRSIIVYIHGYYTKYRRIEKYIIQFLLYFCRIHVVHDDIDVWVIVTHFYTSIQFIKNIVVGGVICI